MTTQLQALLQEHTHLALTYAKAMLGVDEQIMYLLQADLRHRRLLHGLQKAGLDAGDFHLELHTTVFALLGLALTPEEEDQWLDRYVTLLEPYLDLPLDYYFSQLPDLAREMVKQLTVNS